MDKQRVQDALVWLNKNEPEAFREFFNAINSVNEWAATIRFSTRPEEWTGFLRKNVKKLMKIDGLYCLNTGIHFLRIVNTRSKVDMLAFIKELNDCSTI